MNMKLKTVVGLLFGTYMSVSAVTVVNERTFTPTPSDMYDLDHGYYYTWGFSDVSKITGGAKITSAVLSFDNINNWAQEQNVLHLWLLDNARNGYMSQTGFLKVYSDSDSYGASHDAFIGWNSGAKTKIADYVDTKGGSSGYGDAGKENSPNAEDKEYRFDETLLGKLNAYIGNTSSFDSFALGFDPDCHYYNKSVTFTVTWETPSVPETGSTLWLLVAGLGALPLGRRFLKA